MIRADQIPDEVVEAVASDIVQTLQSIASENGLTMAGIEEAMDGFREVARASIVAALNAWPGMRVDDTYRWLSDVAIILPMEDKNAES